MEDWDRIHDLILTLKHNLKVPVWAKIRVYPDVEKTRAYAKMIEAAGASVICIHGRTREQVPLPLLTAAYHSLPSVPSM